MAKKIAPKLAEAVKYLTPRRFLRHILVKPGSASSRAEADAASRRKDKNRLDAAADMRVVLSKRKPDWGARFKTVKWQFSH